MKKFFVMLILVAASAVLSASYCQDAMMNIFKAKFDAMNRHDIKGLCSLYSDSARIESTGLDNIIYGPVKLAEVYNRYFKSTPDLSYKITRVTEGKNAVVVEYTSSGTFQKNEKNVPAYYKGKKYSLKNIVRIDIANNKITGESTYFDQVSFLRQMGFFDKRK